MVPKGWEFSKLGNVAELQRGFDLPSTKRIDGNIPIVSSSGVSGYHNEYKVEKPGIVTGRYGSIGNVYYVEENFWPLNTSLWVKNFHSNYPKFIYYLLSSFDFKKFSDKTGVPGVNRNDLHAVKVAVPPLLEQKKIVKILSTWDKAISTTERLIDNSAQQKKALMQQLLTGKKRLLDDSGERFEGEWTRKPISFVADVITGNTPSTKNQNYYGGDKLFVSPSDLGISKYILKTTKRLTDIGFSQTRKVPKGSSLFTCIGSTIGKLGIAGEELATNQQINSVCAKGNNCGEFIYYQLLFHAEQIKGSAATQAVPIINKTNFESQLIFSPPSHEEQKKIATVLTNADKEIELLEQQLADLQQEKKALMQVLLTGKKRVVV